MRQVLVNLLSNAVKFTPWGGNVVVKASVGADKGVIMSVLDTGIGINPADIDKVSLPFGRLKVHRTRHIEGTGLGLALSKAIVEAHGGRLVLESEVGVGTSASIQLPPSRTAQI
jgi:signal transduction histidine kinase